jgi:signal transduction histidine kinase
VEEASLSGFGEIAINRWWTVKLSVGRYWLLAFALAALQLLSAGERARADELSARILTLLQSKASLLLTILAFALQTGLIVYLLIERRRRRRAEQSLEISEQQTATAEDRLHSVELQYKSTLDEIGERLLALQEEERRRIAAELHDSTAQHLVAIDLFLMRLRPLTSKLGGTDGLIEQIKASLTEAQKELRVFTYLLYPPDLQKEGLKITVDRYVDGFARRTGIAVSADITERTDAIPYPVQRSILRILQEALSNVHRHSQAISVTIKLTMRLDRLVLLIADDGRGMPTTSDAAAPARQGLGIPGMQARVRQFGGEMRIYTGQRGTMLVATIPGKQAGIPAPATLPDFDVSLAPGDQRATAT